MGIIRQHFIISGKVQGVGYRYNSQQQAQQLGITGWVKNLTSGQVEIIAEANTATLRQFEKWLALGPPNAKVTKVDVETLTAENAFSTFSIRR
jgi:acylphosphatase